MSLSTMIVGAIVIIVISLVIWVLWRRYRLHKPRKQSRRRKKKRTQSSVQSRSHDIPPNKYPPSPLRDSLEQNSDYWASKKRSLDRDARQQSETFHSSSSHHHHHNHHHHKVLNIPSIPQRQERVPSYSDDDIEEDG